MTGIDKRTRLSPPLMHVFRAAHQAKDAKRRMDLRDEAGERVLPGRRTRARHVITESVLRQEVARDLDSLLNTIALESTVDMSETPLARKSIINFGLPDISHRTIDENDLNSVPAEIKEAIMNYEPRLAQSSIHVERDMTVDPGELKVRYIVRADLTCDPVHIPVEFVADVIDSAKIVISRL